jgi:hypothetical protein
MGCSQVLLMLLFLDEKEFNQYFILFSIDFITYLSFGLIPIKRKNKENGKPNIIHT